MSESCIKFSCTRIERVERKVSRVIQRHQMSCVWAIRHKNIAFFFFTAYWKQSRFALSILILMRQKFTALLGNSNEQITGVSCILFSQCGYLTLSYAWVHTLSLLISFPGLFIFPWLVFFFKWYIIRSLFWNYKQLITRFTHLIKSYAHQLWQNNDSSKGKVACAIFI